MHMYIICAYAHVYDMRDIGQSWCICLLSIVYTCDNIAYAHKCHAVDL